MPIIKTKDKTMLFVHVPKCGGSSVEHWLAQYGVIALKDIDNPTYSKCSPQHFHAEVLEKLFNKEYFDYVFMIVRNPYNRIISEYNMRMKFGNYKKLPFSDWLNETQSAYKKNPWYLDNHVRPQSDFICFDCDIYKIEEDISCLQSQLALLLDQKFTPLPHIFKSDSALTINDIKNDDRKIIAEMYAEDFTRFNYKL